MSHTKYSASKSSGDKEDNVHVFLWLKPRNTYGGTVLATIKLKLVKDHWAVLHSNIQASKLHALEEDF